MKRIISILMLLTVLSLSLSGCKSKTAKGNNGQARQRSNQQGQFQAADLSGEVTEINGKEITIKVIEMPQFNRGNNGQGNNNQSGNNQGGRYQGGNGQDNNQNGGQNNKNPGNGGNPQPGGGRAFNYTGETKTITIPDGISITTRDRANNGVQSKNIELKDIVKGDILQIYYSDKDKGTISKINVMTVQSNNNLSNNSSKL